VPRRGVVLRLFPGLAGLPRRHPGGGLTAVPMAAKTVRQSVRRRRFGAEIPRRATRAVPGEFAQSRYERDLTAGSIRTQNPLPARACGFKSHLRHLVFQGLVVRGRLAAPEDKVANPNQTQIRWVQETDWRLRLTGSGHALAVASGIVLQNLVRQSLTLERRQLLSPGFQVPFSQTRRMTNIGRRPHSLIAADSEVAPMLVAREPLRRARVDTAYRCRLDSTRSTATCHPG